METKKIETFKTPLRSVVRLSGSKSVTNRAMILAALAGGTWRLEGALFSRDTEIMADCLSELGCLVEASSSECIFKITSSGLPKVLNAKLFVGNAGTAARFVVAFAALTKGGEYVFDSDQAMYARPMRGLFDALKEWGAEFEFLKSDNAFPFKMRTNGLKGGALKVDAKASSQILSALLMSSVRADVDSLISLDGDTVSRPFVDMTLAMMKEFGFEVSAQSSSEFSLSRAGAPASCVERVYSIEPDATAASYFETLPSLVGGACLIENFGECKKQGDAKYIDVLVEADLVEVSNVDGDLLVRAKNILPADLLKADFDFNAISDTFLTLAAASAFAKTQVSITGIAHTRAQETDRVLALATELKKLGAQVDFGADSIKISAGKLPDSVRISTYDDHRIAMSFAIVGSKNLGSEAWMEIENPACVGKTWRNFFEVLEKARQDSCKFKIVAIDGGAAVGKSSVSRECSSVLRYMHVDTGAHYRTLTFGLLESGITPDDLSAIGEHLESLQLSTILVGNSARAAINGALVEDSQIRNERVNASVAKFASLEVVRNFLKNYQRSMVDFAKENGFDGLIMEGRDIASVIFPNAEVRVFLDADEATRAARRAAEGISDSIGKRDEMDKKRKTAPLVCAEGAIRIDTSYMTKREVVDKTLSLILKA